ncbi:MAG: hypothetical protein HKN36_13900 [Hellea sp.]|nr:hypothetical protein [Hellea sp.]
MPPLFIINQRGSRVQKKGSSLASIAGQVGAAIINASSLETFQEQLAEHMKSDPEHIFIEGGDGTAHIVLTEYFRRLGNRKPARFTIVSGGTTNQIAGVIGTKKIDLTQVQKILSGQAANVHQIPLLEISIDGSPSEYGFLFSSGAIPMATDYFQTRKAEKGGANTSAVYSTILKALGRGTGSGNALIEPSPVKLTVTNPKDEIRIAEDHLGTILTTMPGFIMGIDPFWGKGDAPLRMTYLRGDNKKVVRLVLSAALRRFEKLKKTEGVESWNAEFVRLEYDGPTTLDGEKLAVSKSAIEIRPTRPITFIS